jgi:hypothetical protein
MKTAVTIWAVLLTLTQVHAVRGAEIRIQGGPTVEVGERVSIVCSCNVFLECLNEVHFEIRGVKYNFTTLKNGGAPGYQFTPDEDASSFIADHKLILVSATMDDTGTTYRCIPSLSDRDETEWSNRVTLTVRESATSPTNTMTKSSAIFISSIPKSRVYYESSFSSIIESATQTAHTGVATPTAPTGVATSSLQFSILSSTSSVYITDIITGTTTLTPSSIPLQTTEQVTSLSTLLPLVTQTTRTEYATTEGGITVYSEKVTELTKDDAPTYVYVAVGSGVGIVVYILTIVLIGLVISLKIKAKKGAQHSGSSSTSSWDGPGTDRHQNPIPMVTNPVYSDMMTPSSPAPPYFKDDPCMFGDRQVIVNMDSRYHDVPQRKSVAAESLYDYIDMQ